MKQLLLFLVVFNILHLAASAQVAINTTGAAPNASAMLDVTATNKGILVPRMSTTARAAIATPAKGLMVYDSTTNGFWYYTGAAWTQVGAGASTGWSLTGNAGTTPADFIGTTDTMPIRFMTGNLVAGCLNPYHGNTAIGTVSMYNDPQINNNTALGGDALEFISTANNNTAIGEESLVKTNGNANTGVGFQVMIYNSTGYSNVAVGAMALFNSTVDHNVVAFGDSALYHSNNTTAAGSGNTAIGSKALYSETGKGLGVNTAVGYHALMGNTTGAANTANGYTVLAANTTGSYNTGSGGYALGLNSTGSNNSATGYHALYHNTAGDNTANGFNALAANTTGSPNDAFGYIALQSNLTGGDNAAFGAYALQFSTQNDNTGIGVGAISQITSGSSNTALGYNAGQHLTAGSGNIVIGASANLPSATGSNQLSIGNWIYGLNGNIGIGTAAPTALLSVNGSANKPGGGSWAVFSDARLKQHVKQYTDGLDAIMRINPVSFHYNAASGFDTRPEYVGVIAQDLMEVAPYMVNVAAKGEEKKEYYQVDNSAMTYMLINAVKEQQAMIDELKKEVEDLKALVKK